MDTGQYFKQVGGEYLIGQRGLFWMPEKMEAALQMSKRRSVSGPVHFANDVNHKRNEIYFIQNDCMHALNLENLEQRLLYQAPSGFHLHSGLTGAMPSRIRVLSGLMWKTEKWRNCGRRSAGSVM